MGYWTQTFFIAQAIVAPFDVHFFEGEELDLEYYLDASYDDFDPPEPAPPEPTDSPDPPQTEE